MIFNLDYGNEDNKNSKDKNTSNLKVLNYKNINYEIDNKFVSEYEKETGIFNDFENSVEKNEENININEEEENYILIYFQ